VIQPDVIDASNRSIGVRVRRQQNTPRSGMKLEDFAEELSAGHSRHSLIDKKQGDWYAAPRKLLRGFYCLGAGARSHDAIIGAILRSQITIDRGENCQVVIDDKNDWLGQRAAKYAASWRETTLR
jgi:hypothetical protein